MKTIVVASHNPVKVRAVVAAFQRVFFNQEFAILNVSVPSGVSHQPRSDAETLQGASNRVVEAQRIVPAADFWVGIEGGVEEIKDTDPDPVDAMTAFAWVVVRGAGMHHRQLIGRSRTGTFFLPSAVADLVRQGKELGDADDIIFGRTNSKQENGAVGLLTGDVINRAQLYEQAVILALIPFKNEELYSAERSSKPSV